MKQCTLDPQKYGSILNKVVCLPTYLLQNHEQKNLAHAVLYVLGHDNCFGLERGAYLIDNPEFDCLKGCVGFTRGECDVSSDAVLASLVDTEQTLCQTPYNHKVQHLQYPSLKKQEDDATQKSLYERVCRDLNFAHPECIRWPMKHGNQGLFIFEEATHHADHAFKDLLTYAMSLLGFCPVS